MLRINKMNIQFFKTFSYLIFFSSKIQRLLRYKYKFTGISRYTILKIEMKILNLKNRFWFNIRTNTSLLLNFLCIYFSGSQFLLIINFLNCSIQQFLIKKNTHKFWRQSGICLYIYCENWSIIIDYANLMERARVDI